MHAYQALTADTWCSASSSVLTQSSCAASFAFRHATCSCAAPKSCLCSLALDVVSSDLPGPAACLICIRLSQREEMMLRSSAPWQDRAISAAHAFRESPSSEGVAARPPVPPSSPFSHGHSPGLSSAVVLGTTCSVGLRMHKAPLYSKCTEFTGISQCMDGCIVVPHD